MGSGWGVVSGWGSPNQGSYGTMMMTMTTCAWLQNVVPAYNRTRLWMVHDDVSQTKISVMDFLEIAWKWNMCVRGSAETWGWAGPLTPRPLLTFFFFNFRFWRQLVKPLFPPPKHHDSVLWAFLFPFPPSGLLAALVSEMSEPCPPQQSKGKGIFFAQVQDKSAQCTSHNPFQALNLDATGDKGPLHTTLPAG